jgi:hypothetical protein
MSHPAIRSLLLLVAVAVAPSSTPAFAEQSAIQPGTETGGAPAGNETWLPLFNGKDLSGWAPKIQGYDLGDNYADTFRVEDGLLKVRYDKYEGPFNNRYGHLFYEKPFSNYVLRIEYRFVGEQPPGGQAWARRNSGVMFHGQSAASMRKEQNFPVSLEAQFLGGDGTRPRTTANLCTPGTHVVYNGRLHTEHCTNSTSETFHGDRWVTFELEVHGNKLIRHKVNGTTVIEYSQPQLDDRDPDGRRLLESGVEKMLSSGTISLQSESAPIDFRKVELRELSE